MSIYTNRLLAVALMLVLIGPVNTFAFTVDQTEAGYRNLMQVEPVPVVVPTVVELPLGQQRLERPEFMVVEAETGKYLPSYYLERYTVRPATTSVTTAGGENPVEYLIDEDPKTGVYYSLPEDYSGEAEIVLETEESVMVSGLTVALEQNVSLPTSIEVRSFDEAGGEQIVLAKTPMNSGRVSFIPTSADRWVVKFTYVQPLQINELSLIQTDVEKSVERGLRFLAQPSTAYTVYQNPDRTVKLPKVESGNLSDDEGVLLLPVVPLLENSVYKPLDRDNDGIEDLKDNCVMQANPDQEDIDENGRGDICDDWDRDGVINSVDNCPDTPNSSRLDTDGDGIGDACDEEESRLTEKHEWVPWVGILVAVIVIAGMFVVVARRPLGKKESDELKDVDEEPQGQDEQ